MTDESVLPKAKIGILFNVLCGVPPDKRPNLAILNETDFLFLYKDKLSWTQFVSGCGPVSVIVSRIPSQGPAGFRRRALGFACRQAEPPRDENKQPTAQLTPVARAIGTMRVCIVLRYQSNSVSTYGYWVWIRKPGA
jgi:hypothetical protein